LLIDASPVASNSQHGRQTGGAQAPKRCFALPQEIRKTMGKWNKNSMRNNISHFFLKKRYHLFEE